MSGTRSPSPTAPLTDSRAAVIVAHGSPSAPDAPEAAVGALAERVARRLPGWTVRGATLSARGALKRTLEELPSARALVYPLFMSDGWFVSQALPRRMRQDWPGSFEVLPPLGLDPRLTMLCITKIKRAVKAFGSAADKTTVLLAAHGARSDPRPGQIARQVVQSLSTQNLFREVRVGFLEQEPFVEEAARIPGPAVCLPFFAGQAGHVKVDLPNALAAASFPGHLIGPIGASPEVSEIIAKSLSLHGASSAGPVPALLRGIDARRESSVPRL
ncbi:CbiX/SirB N-terminal domain-containing protein [Pelagibius sp. Alg239-R121]|uniref:CbiX/SirB N-terminal domain-containing protein n=1 Tax=Pelagibius sp. Alg239-R121 TaxID=2993448 RepID=UPI0024A67341|nr:CbiX/SirB N-terminal domain-containing protein [Pelagibius sp. Alg239-R121]